MQPRKPVRLRQLRFEHLEARWLLAVGDLDPTFGTGGKVLTSVSVAESSFDEVRDLARQPDGKLVQVGLTRTGHGNVVAISRFQENGLLDPTFDGDGKQTTTIGANDDFASAVAMQPDGKIVVVATSRQALGFYNFAVLRYNGDGSLDESFGDHGVVVTQVGGFHAEPKDVAIQPDGKIVVVGYTSTVNTFYDFAIVRYDENGELDNTLDGDGIAVISVGPESDVPDSVVIQTDGKIVTAGYTRDVGREYRLALARLHSNGSLDSDFDGDGIAIVPFTTSPSPELIYSHEIQLALQNDGKLVAAGLREADGVPSAFGIVRFNSNGSLDGSFGSGDKVNSPASLATHHDVGGLAIQGDGKILIAGPTGTDSSNSSLTVLRYLPSGTLDATFGSGGVVVHNLSPFGFDIVQGIALLPSASIVVGHQGEGEPGFYDFSLVRLNSAGAIDGSFGISGIANVNFFDQFSSVTGDDVVVTNDDKILVAGTRTSARSGYAIAITRYGTNGSLDLTFDGDGRRIIEPSAWYLPLFEGALLAQPDGKLIVAASQQNLSNDLDIYLQRLLPDGTADPSFGSAGITTVSAGAVQERVNCAVLQPDGKILVGASQQINGKLSEVLVRFLKNGQIDASFGTGGFVSLIVGTGHTFIYNLGVQADGKIIAVGRSDSPSGARCTILRLDANGVLDPSFDGDGIVTTGFVGEYTDIAMQPDGKLLAAGDYANGFQLEFLAARYLPNGTLDDSFGVGGKVSTDIGTSHDIGNSLFRLQDGEFIIAGVTENGSGNDFAIAWYTSEGTLDTSVKGTGFSTLRFDRFDNSARSLALLKSGDVIVAGTVNTDTASVMALAKFQGDGVAYVPWHGVDFPLDASRDADHAISPLDALVIINELNERGSHLVPAPQSRNLVRYFLDTSGDNAVSPIDALKVINYLNSPPSLFGGSEGEADPARDVFASASIDVLLWVEGERPARKGERGNHQRRMAVEDEMNSGWERTLDILASAPKDISFSTE